MFLCKFNSGCGSPQTVVSPRNHFLFTPLLPSAVTGTVQLGSIVESVRSLLGRASLASPA